LKEKNIEVPGFIHWWRWVMGVVYLTVLLVGLMFGLLSLLGVQQEQ